MIIASLELPYLELVARARVASPMNGTLSRADRDRVLERLVDRYPEAVATVLSDMGAEPPPPPEPRPQPRWIPAADLVDEPLEVAR